MTKTRFSKNWLSTILTVVFFVSSIVTCGDNLVFGQRDEYSGLQQPQFQDPSIVRGLGRAIRPLPVVNEGAARRFSPEEQVNISVYEKCNRSVVNIDTQAHREAAWFMGGRQTKEGSGSGWVLDQQGHIVTNHHVIAGSDVITVTLSADDDPLPAKIIGSDPVSYTHLTLPTILLV